MKNTFSNKGPWGPQKCGALSNCYICYYC